MCHLKEAINLEGKRGYIAKALAFLVMALFLLACGPTPPPAPKTVPVQTFPKAFSTTNWLKTRLKSANHTC